MRWLFLFVFTLNLAYIAWELTQPAADGYADVPALKNVQPIVLLSELQPQQPDLANTEVDVVAEAHVEIEPTEDESVTAATETKSVGGMADQQAAAKGVASAEVAVEERVLPVQPEKVSDVEQETDSRADSPEQAEAVVAGAEKAAPVDVAQAKPEQKASCYTVGPFRELDKLRGLTREIKSYVVKADFRGREEKEQAIYWVYLKPEKSRKKAIETGKRLKAKKIKDFYVIREGEKENGISLGHFRNKSGAYGLAEKVKNLGFDVTVDPVFRTYTVYWLDYQLSYGVIIPESVFEKYTKTSKKEKISRLSRDCDD